MYDAIVIGGGHAGVEAALALARMNQKTLLVTGNIKMISAMSCNPSIGGPAKGIIVREIDALGGEMGVTTDKTYLQMKMLNHSKGPAVRALRAQSDKILYPKAMQDTLLATPNLTVKEAYVRQLIVNANTIGGILLENGETHLANAVIVTTGTYMEGAILVGNTKVSSGPDKQKPSIGLSAQLRDLGFETFRLKTGTPPRIKRDSIDFSQMQLAPGDGNRYRFSFEEGHVIPPDHEWPCYLIHTAKETHKIIFDNLRKSAMYSGLVKGVGPRYCPSIEDKLVRFSDKERHQLFIEPESQFLDEVYLQGFSTSMPHDVQELMVHSLPGLEHCVIAKYAYAIEYDAIHPTDLWATLESKKITGLYFAGQVNGTSGYEEAAAQGLMAGINAALKLQGKPPLILRRDQAYIGVLIDDLVTKGTEEPYRMLTSRAEFRLLLRHDNADLRLTAIGHEIGLASKRRFDRMMAKKIAVAAEIERFQSILLYPNPETNQRVVAAGLGEIVNKISLYDLLKRPEATYETVLSLIGESVKVDIDVAEQVEIAIKYDGYIKKAIKEADQFSREEQIPIPRDLNYDQMKNLANEARIKLKAVLPLTVGQASRISGVNPADVQTILIHLRQSRTA
jgi:tRNA uridine 5-carboxymethylaminomethyl modification enzyme